MDTDQLRVTTELIAQDFAIENVAGQITEAQLLEILAGQIEVLIEQKMEFLMSLLYRLDIDERKVDFALSPFSPKAPHIAIAELVLERQKLRAFTKMSYKPPILGSEWEAY